MGRLARDSVRTAPTYHSSTGRTDATGTDSMGRTARDMWVVGGSSCGTCGMGRFVRDFVRTAPTWRQEMDAMGRIVWDGSYEACGWYGMVRAERVVAGQFVRDGYCGTDGRGRMVWDRWYGTDVRGRVAWDGCYGTNIVGWMVWGGWYGTDTMERMVCVCSSHDGGMERFDVGRLEGNGRYETDDMDGRCGTDVRGTKHMGLMAWSG